MIKEPSPEDYERKRGENLLSGKGLTMKKHLLAITGFILLGTAFFGQSLTIYCENDKPLQFLDSNGNLSGMTVELVRQIQKRVGNTDEVEMVPWARGLKSLDTLPNVLLLSTTRTAERNHLYQWIGPVFETIFGLYGKKESSIVISSLDEAKTLNGISVYRGDVRDQFLTNAGFLNLERVGDSTTALRMLMLGRVALYAGSSISIKETAQSAGYSMSEIKQVYVLLRSQVYIAASKGTDPLVISQWNDALATMKKDGTFQKIFKSYYPDLELPRPAVATF